MALGSGGLGLQDDATVVIFTIAWVTSALTRLKAFRQGQRPALKLSDLDARTAAALIAGTVPWFFLGFLQSAYATSFVWVPFHVPPQLHALGILFAVAAVAEPFFQSLRKVPPAAEPAPAHGLSIGVVIRSAAILLLSGSFVFSVFCVLWLMVACWPATRVAEPAPAHLFASPSESVSC